MATLMSAAIRHTPPKLQSTIPPGPGTVKPNAPKSAAQKPKAQLSPVLQFVRRTHSAWMSEKKEPAVFLAVAGTGHEQDMVLPDPQARVAGGVGHVIEYRGQVINDVPEHARFFARLPDQLP